MPPSRLTRRSRIQTVEEWDREIAVNLGGVFLCSKFFMPHLRATKGAIVNMSSVNGFFVEPMCAGYCATKAAIIGLTKAMAIDHGKEGIRVNCICPGYIDAGLAEGYFQAQPDPAAARASAGKLHALWRIGRPEEVGRVAVFLASDDASFVTGSAYVVDGGFGSGLPPEQLAQRRRAGTANSRSPCAGRRAGILRDLDLARFLAAIGQRCDRVVIQAIAQTAMQARDAHTVADGCDGIPQRPRGGHAVDFRKSPQLDSDDAGGDRSGQQTLPPRRVVQRHPDPTPRRQRQRG